MGFTETDILRAKEVQAYTDKYLIGVNQYPLGTGFPTWDGACDETGGRGLGDWWYTIIGGASNAGKTQLARFLARRAAEQGYVPAFITMEVSTSGLQRHYYSNVSPSFGYYDLLPFRFDTGGEAVVQGKRKALTKEVNDFSEGTRSLIVVEHDGRPTISEIVEQAHALKEHVGVTHLFIDHAQLIKAPKHMDIAEAAEEFSEQMRMFAHKEKVCTVVLSQLNRTASRDRERRPTMHDLWGGTAMESNANQVAMLDHSRNAMDPQSPHILRTYVILDKNREGPAKLEIPVEVNFRTGMWREASDDELGLWP